LLCVSLHNKHSRIVHQPFFLVQNLVPWLNFCHNFNDFLKKTQINITKFLYTVQVGSQK
jgi:hypothetical protein